MIFGGEEKFNEEEDSLSKLRKRCRPVAQKSGRKGSEMPEYFRGIRIRG